MEIKTIVIEGKTKMVTRPQLDKLIEAKIPYKVIDRKEVN